ncbi:MAG: hypothetical protein ACI9FG_001110 [Crocinitomicaceae bacterium]|jgi:hypothetical protein
MKALLLFLLSVTMASAQYQKLDAPVNANGRTLSFHLYHFNTQKNPAQLHAKPKDISSAVHKRSHLAAVALGSAKLEQKFTLTIQHGMLKVTAGKKAGSAIGPCLFSKNEKLAKLDDKHHSRRTFLLHNGANLWAIGYAPSISQQQLAKALGHICKNGNIRYTTAYQLNAGNSSGLWISNKSYHPFYLKELKPPSSVLSVRLR